jgi:hypothetical protein
MDLNKRQIRAINDAVEDLYDRLKARFLGRFFKGPSIYFELARTSDPGKSIEGIFHYAMTALYGPGAASDDDHLEKLAGITGNYLEAEKLKTLNKLVQDIEQANTPAELDAKIKEIFAKATSKVDTLVVTEARNVSNFAEREGIMQVAATMGVEDPVVARLGPVDQKTCKTCLKLWHTDENPKIPKLYKASEVRDGYTTHKDPFPTWNATHPHCRHIWITVAPNYGFDETGRLKFKGFGYDAYKEQRGDSAPITKSDSGEPIWEIPEEFDCDHAA